MIEILPESSERNIGFKIGGKVSAEDYELLLPKLDEAIKEYGKANLLVVMDEFDGWAGLEAAKADFKFGIQEYRQVEKAAFVGDKKWQRGMIRIMDPFARHTDERYFDLDQLEDAWRWIMGK